MNPASKADASLGSHLSRTCSSILSGDVASWRVVTNGLFDALPPPLLF